MQTRRMLWFLAAVAAGLVLVSSVAAGWARATERVNADSATSQHIDHGLEASTGSDEQWTELIADGAPGSPPRRDGFGAAWDPVARALYVFGGRTESGSCNDLWRWEASSNSWTELSPSGGPPPARWRPSAVWDPGTGTLLVFGGDESNDLWRYSAAGNSWTQLTPSGDLPPGRNEHRAVWDPINNQMLVFGGFTASGPLGDLWSYKPGTNAWTQLSPAGSAPAARGIYGAAWDGSGMLIFGGNGGGGLFLNDLWRYSPATNSWTQLSPVGTLPSPRNGARIAWNSANGVLQMFGGFDWESGHRNDLWTYSIATNAWTQMNPTGGPPAPRAFHEVVEDEANNRMLVFGGYSYDHGFFNDLWSLQGPKFLYVPHGTNGANVTKLDASTGSILATIPMSHGHDIAFLPSGTKAYVPDGSDHVVRVIETSTDTVVATISFGGTSWGPAYVAVTPDGSRVYATRGGEDTVHVISTATDALVGPPITVGDLPNGIAITPDGAKAYVVNELGNNVSVIDLTTNTVAATIASEQFAYPYDVVVRPDGLRAYVANFGASTVTEIDTTADSVVGSAIPVGEAPSDIAVLPDGSHVYTANQYTNYASVVDTASRSEVATISTSCAPYPSNNTAVATDPDGSAVYVGNLGGCLRKADPATSQIYATFEADGIVAAIGVLGIAATPTPPVCGNGMVESPEQCDPPQADSAQCTQSTSWCSGITLCVRDAYGDCTSQCACSSDAGSCGCQVGQCGAQCASSADCAPGWTCTGCTCVSGTPAPVGGIAELPESAKAPASECGSSARPYALPAGGLAAAVVALTAGAWYARRRWPE